MELEIMTINNLSEIWLEELQYYLNSNFDFS